ncbi:MAG: right-handed parallel beta-helix repeat-containing protein [Planctomycetes bacterium]|nr:right-handed parallel beta-helix repeat-containing protein [Planctomycetota bacterium]
MNAHLLMSTVFLVSSFASGQTMWYVDQASCPGPGNGTPAQPFCLIQDGILAAANGDTVLVLPGTYLENLDFLGKAITVRSRSGPVVTIIDANQAGSAVAFVTGEGPQSVIEGFTLTNGSGTPLGAGTGEGGGVACAGSSPTIRANHIVFNSPAAGGGISCRNGASPHIVGNYIGGNQAPNAGGGIYLTTNCSPLIQDNFIVGNTVARATGGGIYCGYSSAPTLVNNTITGNVALNFGAMFSYQSNPVITNTICWGNAPNELNASGTITYCVVQGGMAGTGNLNLDPLFADPGARDFHLQAGSPCRDLGDNSAPSLTAFDFEGDPRIAQGTVDIGADEFHPHLYTVRTVMPWANVEMRIVGDASASPVAIALGTGALPAPIPVPPFGDWWLLPPVYILFTGSVPATGIFAATGMLPGPAPYDLNFQGFVQSVFTNQLVLQVR